MAAEPTKPIKIFYCYARKDKALRDELEQHLGLLKRSGQINTWHDFEIRPGAEWERVIDAQLNTSNIILLLISPDFIASDYCYSVEMKRALERHKAGEAYVIPIILRPVDWIETPIGQLQALPLGARPITTWANRNEALRSVAEEVGKIVQTFQSHPEKISERRENRQLVETTPKSKEPASAIRVSCCYVSEDKALLDDLWTHLSTLKRLGFITEFYDRDIQLGMDWSREVDMHLEIADIILLLVSPKFLTSNYCDGMEMLRLLERHKIGDAHIIPIIVRSVELEGTKISEIRLQVLPTDELPITEWRDHDEAFWDVAKGIGKIVKTLLSRPQKMRAEETNGTFSAQDKRSFVSAVLENKIAHGNFDVFLCYNSKSKSEVKKIGEKLKEQGILPWLDEWELPPGIPWQRLLEKQIGQIKSAAVFVGKDGVGPWQQFEIEVFLREFVRRRCPVIPVLMADAPRKPKLPLFLAGITWVDFRKQDTEPIGQLVWGITGKRPIR